MRKQVHKICHRVALYADYKVSFHTKPVRAG